MLSSKIKRIITSESIFCKALIHKLHKNFFNKTLKQAKDILRTVEILLLTLNFFPSVPHVCFKPDFSSTFNKLPKVSYFLVNWEFNFLPIKSLPTSRITFFYYKIVWKMIEGEILHEILKGTLKTASARKTRVESRVDMQKVIADGWVKSFLLVKNEGMNAV